MQRSTSDLLRALEAVPGGAILVKHARLIVACTVLVPLVALVAHLVLPQAFVSQARVLMMLGREFQGDPGPGGGTNSMYRLAEAINSEIEILTSNELARNVVAEVGLETLFPDIAEDAPSEEVAEQQAAFALLESISVTGIAESSVIRLALAHTDPSIAKAALAALIDQFLETHLGVFGDDRIQVAQAVLDQSQKNLAEAEAARSSFWTENGIHDPDRERGLLLDRREQLATQRRALTAELLALDGDSDSVDPPVADGAGGSTAEDELVTLRAEETRLLNNYYSTSKAVQTVRAQIFALENQIERQREARRSAIEQEFAELDTELARIEQQLETLRANGRTIRELERAVLNAEQLSATALADLTEAQAKARLDAERVSSVRVIDPPTLPLEPLGLSLAIKLILGVIVGLLLGVAAALGLHLAGPLMEQERLRAAA